MKVVVPLAGPDFENADGRVKAELEVDGRSLFQRTLDQRIWWRRGQVRDQDLIFVMKHSEISRRFAERQLRARYPRSRKVFLCEETRGAALSALAGVAATASLDQPLCIDLVDIEYSSSFDPIELFRNRPEVGAAALVFPSDNPVYSYLRTGDDGDVVEAAEKRVISRQASAGTYFFASAAVYLSALAHNIAAPTAHLHRGSFYVCPVLNGVLESRLKVVMEPVWDVRDPKMAASPAAY